MAHYEKLKFIQCPYLYRFNRFPKIHQIISKGSRDTRVVKTKLIGLCKNTPANNELERRTFIAFENYTNIFATIDVILSQILGFTDDPKKFCEWIYTTK